MDSSLFFGLSLLMYLVASVTYISYLAFRHEKVGVAATVITSAGFLTQTAALGLRWVESYREGYGHIPLSTMYESAVFWTWSTVLIYLIFERLYRNRTLGAIVTPLAFIAIAAVSLAPNVSKTIEPLVPALQSNWLTVHVMTCFVGYSAFAISFGMSVIYLVTVSKKRTEGFYLVGIFGVVMVLTLLAAIAVDFAAPLLTGAARPRLFAASLTSSSLEVSVISWLTVAFFAVLFWYFVVEHRGRIAKLLPSARLLEDVSYKTVMIGFPMLTLGIVTGAAWANYAWGTYWSWDPKETWSLITWFVYAAFLHARFTAGWKGQKTSVLSVVGFGSVLFTYIGVNYFLSGLHTYN